METGFNLTNNNSFVVNSSIQHDSFFPSAPPNELFDYPLSPSDSFFATFKDPGPLPENIYLEEDVQPSIAIPNQTPSTDFEEATTQPFRWKVISGALSTQSVFGRICCLEEEVVFDQIAGLYRFNKLKPHNYKFLIPANCFDARNRVNFEVKYEGKTETVTQTKPAPSPSKKWDTFPVDFYNVKFSSGQGPQRTAELVLSQDNIELRSERVLISQLIRKQVKKPSRPVKLKITEVKSKPTPTPVFIEESPVAQPPLASVSNSAPEEEVDQLFWAKQLASINFKKQTAPLSYERKLTSSSYIQPGEADPFSRFPLIKPQGLGWREKTDTVIYTQILRLKGIVHSDLNTGIYQLYRRGAPYSVLIPHNYFDASNPVSFEIQLGMKKCFVSMIDRESTDSIKWDLYPIDILNVSISSTSAKKTAELILSQGEKTLTSHPVLIFDRLREPRKKPTNDTLGKNY